ncbi:hypothetical protein VFPPC_16939 [Pochonia chlamydosporia 170]|uniref:Uncharacterized protein n=1 Tax=Pochonia chlamydosporia 170 TaxID=1380566 RepID=A0A179EZU4_METCM|nr:hypothetical protein VFPPC_16939 [Pochonia chlamydosporia 170]OAQ58672.1 hypothetical protein VFPPC_16939 [Pochonia chlamydosporia 170]
MSGATIAIALVIHVESKSCCSSATSLLSDGLQQNAGKPPSGTLFRALSSTWITRRSTGIWWLDFSVAWSVHGSLGNHWEGTYGILEWNQRPNERMDLGPCHMIVMLKIRSTRLLGSQ